MEPGDKSRRASLTAAAAAVVVLVYLGDFITRQVKGVRVLRTSFRILDQTAEWQVRRKNTRLMPEAEVPACGVE